MQKSILIVEDEILIAMDLQLMLEARGWRVIGPASDVREALALLEIEVPAVALLDVNLGGEVVTPVAEALRSRGIPFALSSAYDHPERYGGDVLAGVPNARKPTNEARVVAVLNRLTES